MLPSRRELLASLPVLAALPACTDPDPVPDPEDPPIGPCGVEPTTGWEAPGVENESAFQWGVQTTDATPDGFLVSARTTLTGPLTLRLAQACEGAWEELDPFQIEVSADGMLQTELGGLDSDALYNIALYGTDEEGRSPVARFRTASAPSTRRVIRFGASACFGSANRPLNSLARAAEQELDFFCLLGDNVYADGSDTLEEYREHWNDTMSDPGFSALTRSTSVITTWDDHEVDNNWSWDDSGIEGRFDAARAALSESLPWREGPAGTGLWRKLSWGQTLDVFVLDCRGERQGDDYLSPGQMDWFKAELAASTARFKIIMNSVPIADLELLLGPVLAEDRWQGYPEQRAEILQWIEDQGIGGVLWLAGDLHYGSVGTVDPPGGLAAAQWEVLCGPSGSTFNHFPELVESGPSYTGDLLAQIPDLIHTWNYTWFEADPDVGTILVRHYDDDGVLVNERLLDL